MSTISFYRKCGFHYSHTVPDFFTVNYDHPIEEDGKIPVSYTHLKHSANGCPPRYRHFLIGKGLLPLSHNFPDRLIAETTKAD